MQMEEIINKGLSQDVAGWNPCLFLWPIPLPVDQILDATPTSMDIQQLTHSGGRASINEKGEGGGTAGGERGEGRMA